MVRSLEDQYSWEELGILIADRIEKNDFIHGREWSRRDFLKWWTKREKVGYRFDWQLVARCWVIWKSLQKKHDHFIVVVGKEGSGKSTLAFQIASFISINFTDKDIVFDMPQYVNQLQKVSQSFKKWKKKRKNSCIVIDEGGISLFSRESLSKGNKMLAKTFMIQRFLCVCTIICIPYYWNLDKLVRQHRVNTLITVKKRGYYFTVVGKGISILNKLGMKSPDKNLWAIPIPYGLFWEGVFRKPFPNTLDEKKYNKRKLN